MAFSEKEVGLIMERMRQGNSVTHSHSGGRYSSTWSWEGDHWQLDSWEEGTSFVRQLTDDEMRAAIAAGPEELFLKMLGR